MFRRLRFENFKAWQDTQEIRMAPLTLFFGANSSGKSSIGQFLLMLKQTVEVPDRKAVLHPGGTNSPAQLGSFQQLIFHRDLQNRIKFEYEWDLPAPLRVKDPLSPTFFSGNIVAFSAAVGISDIDQHSLVVDHFRYVISGDSKVVLTIGMRRHPAEKSKYAVEAEYYPLVRKPGRAWSPQEPVRFYGFPDEVVAYHQNADFVQELNLLHEQLFRSISYLGPLRTKAERLYSWGRTEPEGVGYSGENTIAAILSARNRKIGLRKGRSTNSFEEIIAAQLKMMGLIEDFKVNPISEYRDEYEVKVRSRGSSDWVDLPDVGFGVWQVLPVLVQCFYAPRGSIIIVEQPEIHLHPAAQSALADVMIDVIHSRELGADRNVQVIIETHSEHFLRRLQRRIAEKSVDISKISAYVANVTRLPVRLDALQIDTYGNILNWPAHFFGDEMLDITEQAKAAMKRRLGEVKESE